jgi:hypothetical protein
MKNSTWPTSLFRRCVRRREIIFKSFFKKDLDKFHRKSLPEGEGEDSEMKRDADFAVLLPLPLGEDRGEGKGEGKSHAQKNHSASFLLDALGSSHSSSGAAAEESLSDRISIVVRSR